MYCPCLDHTSGESYTSQAILVTYILTLLAGKENMDPEQDERPTRKRKGRARKGTEDAEATAGKHL